VRGAWFGKNSEVLVISQELLSILACPVCKTKVVLENDLLVCNACGRRYPIRDGIPVMLVDEGDRLRVDPASAKPAQDRDANTG
jgi:uncharacterized protein YbaR (Trm112 family)